MKKTLLCLTFLASALAAFAQTVPLTNNWSKLRKDNDAVFGTTAERPSVAYNAGTDKLYLSDRNNKIDILDPATGNLSSPAALPMPADAATTWTESYKYTKIRVADDGAIYAVSMVTTAGTTYIYRWASETDAAPTRTAIAVPARSGESFAVLGSGNNTKLYLSGANSAFVTVAKVTNGVITKEFDISITNNQARGSISAESTTSLWLNTPNSGAGFETRRVNFNASTGSVSTTDVVPGSKIDWAHANTQYFQDGTKKFLAVSGAVIGGTPAASNVGLKMKIYDITNDVSNPVLKSETEMFPYVAGSQPVASSNTNGYNDVAIKKNPDGTHTFFHVVFGNGLASYTTVGTLPVTLTSFNAALIKGQSTLTWETASESNNKGFEVLRSVDGKTFSKIGFVASMAANGNSAVALKYNYTDYTAAHGLNYYQLHQVDYDGRSELFNNVVSVNVNLTNNEISAFPNPVATHVSINAGNADFKGLNYELFDTRGNKILSQQANSQEQRLEMANLVPSVYILKVTKNNVPQKTIKLIKQ
jgi:hypothetical protein